MNIENYLNENKFTTRKELEIRTGLTDRGVRNKISYLKKRIPVISNSKNKGYRLAKDIENLNNINEINAELRQINICIAEIEARKKDLSRSEKTYISYKLKLEKKLNSLT